MSAELALPASRGLWAITRPVIDGRIAVLPGTRDIATSADLRRAMAEAPWMVLAAAGPPMLRAGSPSGARIGDGVTPISTLDAGPVTVCAFAGSGWPPVVAAHEVDPRPGDPPPACRTTAGEPVVLRTEP